MNFDDFGSELASFAVLAILDLETTDAGDLFRCEGDIVFVLRLLGRVFNHDVDVVLDEALLGGNDVHEVDILENLGRLELGGQDNIGLGRACEHRRKKPKKGRDD